MGKLRIDKGSVSERAWGEVDTGALGRRLAEAYAAGDVTRAVVREVYAYVPAGAFGEDGEGRAVFAWEEAWGPHYEVVGDRVVLNRGGVHATVEALGELDVSAVRVVDAQRHLRKQYRHLGEPEPGGLRESGPLARGTPLDELVKGSLDYVLQTIRDAFYLQFKDVWEDVPWIVEVFGDYVIVNGRELAINKYYLVWYEWESPPSVPPDGGEAVPVFDPPERWEVVELAYQPKGRMEEGRQTRQVGQRLRLVEELAQPVLLVEGKEGEKRLRAVGITADVVNGNGRRYAAHVLRAAIEDLKSHLHESAGQGRAIQLLGEPEHPSEKPSRRASVLETVIRWDQVEFDGQYILLEGVVIPTSKGKDILALLEGGVKIGLSQRGYGYSEMVEEDGQKVEVVTELIITGYDLKLPGEQSDPEAGITVVESQMEMEDDEMELNLEVLKEKYPELVEKLLKEHDQEKKQALEEELGRRQAEDERIQRIVAEREKALREKLGLNETADLVAAMEQSQGRLQELEEAERQRAVDAYVAEQVGGLKYPDWLREQMLEALQADGPKSVDEAKAMIAGKRKEYDAIMAKIELAQKGMGVNVLGPVLERERGVPEFARYSFQLVEGLVNSGLAVPRNWNEPKNVNERFAKLYLALFDKTYKHHLLREAREMEEAEQASDLSLPYTVSRAVVAEAVPRLIATSVFDVGIAQSSEERVYYEAYSGETGASVTITDEDTTSDEGAWVSLDYKHVQPGTVTLEPNGGGTAYTEGTDYVMDYLNGRYWTLATGTIGDGTALDATYTYYAYRKGEMLGIERGKMTLTYTTLSMAADRLATQISREAVVFSRSQIGYDATARTLASLVRQVQRAIDQGLLYLALAAALKVASNSGGTWTSATDDVSELVEKIGVARVLVGNRYYEPTAILMSLTNSDRAANWDGFSAAGLRPDADLNSNGYAGRLKGLPVFESTEFSDSYVVVCNREVVLHRVYQPMQLLGPFPSYDSDRKLIAADQYYAEEFNGSDAPVAEKAAYVIIA